jgi:hypothetical protein
VSADYPSNPTGISSGLVMLASAGRRNEMHPEDLMKPDLFSEIVLMGSGGMLFAFLMLIVVIAFTRV